MTPLHLRSDSLDLFRTKCNFCCNDRCSRRAQHHRPPRNMCTSQTRPQFTGGHSRAADGGRRYPQPGAERCRAVPMIRHLARATRMPVPLHVPLRRHAAPYVLERAVAVLAVDVALSVDR